MRVALCASVFFAAFGTASVLAQESSAATAPAAKTAAPTGKASASQKHLLELANQAFLRMPLVPHIKNRGRGQMAVVEACFELAMPDLALQIGDTIPDWRRGLAHAQFAHHCAQAGRMDEVGQHLAIAESVAKAAAADPTEQAWRADRVFAMIARTHFLLGDAEKFAKFSKSIQSSDGAGIQMDAALAMPEAAFSAWLEQADKLFAGDNFDEILVTLQTCCKLYKRFFPDAEKRDQLEKRVTSGYTKLPRDARLKLLIEIAGYAADGGDGMRALELVRQIDVLIAGVKWHPEDEVFVHAQAAAVVHRAGDSARGRTLLEHAESLYGQRHASILDIYRASAMRAIAEAAAAMGNRDRALELYRGAVEAGLDNPNSRPRADDVSATCLSLAKHGLEPGSELLGKIEAIVKGLGDPW